MDTTHVSLECHLEWPHHAVHLPESWPTTDPQAVEVTYRLLRLCLRHQVTGTFYVLGHVAKQEPKLIEDIVSSGHQLGSHGYWHRHGEQEGDWSDQLTRALLPHCVGYRSPFWETTSRPGWCGGVFFRTLPYHWLRWEMLSSGVLYLHPHDFYATSGGPARRRWFFCDPWVRLERLLSEGFFHATHPDPVGVVGSSAARPPVAVQAALG